MTKRRRRHTPEQIVKKLRDADAMLNSSKDMAAVLQTLEVSEATYSRWRNQYGGMKSEEAKRLKQLEDENKRLKPFSKVCGRPSAAKRVSCFRASCLSAVESASQYSALRIVSSE